MSIEKCIQGAEGENSGHWDSPHPSSSYSEQVGEYQNLTTVVFNGKQSNVDVDISSTFVIKTDRHDSSKWRIFPPGNKRQLMTSKSLCDEIKKLRFKTTLHTLIVDGCEGLTVLPNEFNNNEFNNLKAMLQQLDNFKSLKTLKVLQCFSIMWLPRELGNITSLTTLNLKGCSSLILLPRELGNLTSLTTLDLQNCRRLKSLPSEMGNLTSLTTLNLKGCSSLTSLPSELGNLKSLITLNLQECNHLYSLPIELGELTSLRTLNLQECNHLYSLPNEIGYLSSLTNLNLEGSLRLTSLPYKFVNLTSLTTLNLQNCSSLTSLPNELGNLKSLTTFNLQYCLSLKSLPSELGYLTSLITLDLRRCSNLASLPIELGKLTSLTTLNLQDCSSLTSLPSELGKLTSLTTLNLQDCSRLTSLPSELGKLTSLTTLNLQRCSSLTSLPSELGKVTSLTTLHLQQCYDLKSLPSELGNLTYLTTLNLNQCYNLKSLPSELCNIKSLTTLDLQQCYDLKSLPSKLGNLSSLSTLNLQDCSRLMSLPSELGNLTSLTTLSLQDCCCLKSLPSELGNLTSLTILNLRGCSSLTSLPNELGKITSLITLDLQDCSSLTPLPSASSNLKSLTTLSLKESSSLTPLPSASSNLTSLTTLNLKGSARLTSLPKEEDKITPSTSKKFQKSLRLTPMLKKLSNPTSLNDSNITRCKSLTSLPNQVDNLSSRTTLNLNMLSKDEIQELVKALQDEISSIESITSVASFHPHSLGKEKINTLCFFNEMDSSYEFYFEDHRSMGEIIGIGLDYAKVTLESGWQIKVFEITEENYRNTWNNYESIPNTLLMTLQKPRSHPSAEGDGKLPKTDTQGGRHVLWDIAKYYILNSALSSLISKVEALSDDHVSMSDAAKTRPRTLKDAPSSSSSIPKAKSYTLFDRIKRVLDGAKRRPHTSDESPSSSSSIPTSKTNTLFDRIKQEVYQIFYGKILNPLLKGTEKDLKVGLIDPDPQEATKVHLSLLPGGSHDKRYRTNDERDELKKQSIVPKMEFVFKRENGQRSIDVIVGPSNFELNPENKAICENFKKYGWFHKELNVKFGPADAAWASLSNCVILDCSEDKDTRNESTALANMRGSETQMNGSLRIGPVPTVVLGGCYTNSTATTTTSTVDISRSGTVARTKNGFTIRQLEFNNTLTCRCFDEEQTTIQYERLEDPNYRQTIYNTSCCLTQTVKYQGTWSPNVTLEDGLNNRPQEMVQYEFEAHRTMMMKEWTTSELNVGKKLKNYFVFRRSVAEPKESCVEYKQRLSRTLYINHAMTNLDNNVYRVSERRTESGTEFRSDQNPRSERFRQYVNDRAPEIPPLPSNVNSGHA